MLCPNCGQETGVVDTLKLAKAVYRSRVCRGCRAIFSTREEVAEGVWFNRKRGKVFSGEDEVNG